MKITTEKLKQFITGPIYPRFRELFRIKFKKRDYIFGFIREENVVEELAKEVGRIGKDIVFTDPRTEVLKTKVLFDPNNLPEGVKQREALREFTQTIKNIKESRIKNDPNYFVEEDQ